MRALAILPSDPWMEINLLATLREHYCDEVCVFAYSGPMVQLGERTWREKRKRINEDVIELARTLRVAGKLDFIFCNVYDDFLTVKAAKQLRDLNVPMVNYHFDMAFQWYRMIRIAPYFDVIAVAQMANADHLSQYNPNIEWMPMAANPDFYHARTRTVSDYRYGVSFVGSFDPYRRALVAACLQAGFTPTIFGKGWSQEHPTPYRFAWDAYKVMHDLRYYAVPRWRAEGAESLLGPLARKLSRRRRFGRLEGADFQPPCTDESLPEIFRSSRINLGSSDTGWHQEERMVASKNLQCRLRDFEVPMSGGFYLVQRAPDHETYYELGSEIETWSEQDELFDKLSYYMKNESAAGRVREAGQKRALSCHTWRHRFDRLFQRLRREGRMH